MYSTQLWLVEASDVYLATMNTNAFIWNYLDWSPYNSTVSTWDNLAINKLLDGQNVLNFSHQQSCQPFIMFRCNEISKIEIFAKKKKKCNDFSLKKSNFTN